METKIVSIPIWSISTPKYWQNFLAATIADNPSYVDIPHLAVMVEDRLKRKYNVISYIGHQWELDKTTCEVEFATNEDFLQFVLIWS